MAQEQLINDLKKEIEQLKNEGRVLRSEERRVGKEC